MSGTSVVDGALQQQVQAVWKTLQDTRSNLFVCDTLIRQIVKPAPAVSATVSLRTREASMQTNELPVASVGTECVRAAVESACCQAAPELCARGVQTEDFAAAVKSDHCNLATAAEAGVPEKLSAVPRHLAGVPHRDYQRLKRKTEVLKRQLHAERTRSARALSEDSAYRLSALRMAALALSIQETYQEMLLDLGSLLQQLAALVSDAAITVTLPPADGVGGWYRQVRELAAVTLRCLIKQRAEIGLERTEVSEEPSREQSPVENIRHKRDLVAPLTVDGVHTRSQITDRGHSLGFCNAGLRESHHATVESRQRRSPSERTGDEGSAATCRQMSSRSSIRPQSLICSSQKSTSREIQTESETSFPYRARARNLQVARRAAQRRKCSQSHQMCDSDLGPCLKSEESRRRGGGDDTSEESAVDIACCSRTCHHHTYLKTFVEAQKSSQESNFSVKNIILNDSGHHENEASVTEVTNVSPDTQEPLCHSCARATRANSSCEKTRRDGRSRSSLPVSAEAEQKPADEGTQSACVENCITKSSTSTDPSQRDRQPRRWQQPQCLSGTGGQTVAIAAAKGFRSTRSLGNRESPEHLRKRVEVLEKCLTSSDYTETISSSFTLSRTSYNSASSSSVPKTKTTSRRTCCPVTSPATDVRQPGHSPEGNRASAGRGEECWESADGETEMLTPKSGSATTRQDLHFRFVEILDELKEKLLQCDE